MRKNLPLNELFRQYAWGELEKKQFEGLIFEFILENHRSFRLYDWDKEDYIDYVCWLYPRLSRAIDNYRETGASFEAYIASMVRWSAREYRSRQADHHITEYAAWTLRSSELMVHNSEPEYPMPESTTPPQADGVWTLRNESSQQTVINPRQILFLLLKSYYFVSDDFLDRIAPRMGMEKEKLASMVNRLRELRIDREEEIRCLRERIHCQFYRCITFEKRLNAAPESSAHYAKMKSRLERARIRLTAMRKRLAGIRTDATNRQIAEVLGVPKGTVDSNLHALKKRINQAALNTQQPKKINRPEN
jgi:RNA polymerase sigma factor (sigma-70 family)